MIERRIRTDVDGLAKLVNLPEQVESVRWEHRAAKGGSSLVAVLTIKKSALDRLLRSSTRLNVQTPIKLNKETSELMFPKGLGNQAAGQPVEIRGVNIEPGPFVSASKSGLLNGLASIAMDDSLLYLSLFEM